MFCQRYLDRWDRTLTTIKAFDVLVKFSNGETLNENAIAKKSNLRRTAFPLSTTSRGFPRRIFDETQV